MGKFLRETKKTIYDPLRCVSTFWPRVLKYFTGFRPRFLKKSRGPMCKPLLAS